MSGMSITMIYHATGMSLTVLYNPWPCIRKIKQCLVKHWKLLIHNEICKDIFTKEQIIAYKKHRNLRDILTSSKINRYTNLEKADDRSLTLASGLAKKREILIFPRTAGKYWYLPVNTGK